MRIFLIDDQEDVRLLWRIAIERANEGLKVIGEAHDDPSALRSLAGVDVDVVVIDQMMPGMAGVELATHLRRLLGAEIPLVLCSAYLDDRVRADAAAAGINSCWPKEELAGLPDALRAFAN